MPYRLVFVGKPEKKQPWIAAGSGRQNDETHGSSFDFDGDGEQMQTAGEEGTESETPQFRDQHKRSRPPPSGRQARESRVNPRWGGDGDAKKSRWVHVESMAALAGSTEESVADVVQPPLLKRYICSD